MFPDKHPTLTKCEQTMMFDILRRFVHDMEMPLREKVSDVLVETENETDFTSLLRNPN